MSEIDTSKKPQRYCVPGGGGVAPNTCGLLYRREDADAMIDAIASDRDAAVARVAELEAEVERLRQERDDIAISQHLTTLAVRNVTYHAEGYSAGWNAAIEAASTYLQGAADDWRSTGGELPAKKIEDEIPGVIAIPMPADAGEALDRLTAQARAQGMHEALEAAKKSREWVIHSGQRSYIDGIAKGHDRAESAILARAEEIEKRAEK